MTKKSKYIVILPTIHISCYKQMVKDLTEQDIEGKQHFSALSFGPEGKIIKVSRAAEAVRNQNSGGR